MKDHRHQQDLVAYKIRVFANRGNVYLHISLAVTTYLKGPLATIASNG